MKKSRMILFLLLTTLYSIQAENNYPDAAPQAAKKFFIETELQIGPEYTRPIIYLLDPMDEDYTLIDSATLNDDKSPVYEPLLNIGIHAGMILSENLKVYLAINWQRDNNIGFYNNKETIGNYQNEDPGFGYDKIYLNQSALQFSVNGRYSLYLPTKTLPMDFGLYGMGGVGYLRILSTSFKYYRAVWPSEITASRITDGDPDYEAVPLDHNNPVQENNFFATLGMGFAINIEKTHEIYFAFQWEYALFPQFSNIDYYWQTSSDVSEALRVNFNSRQLEGFFSMGYSFCF